MCVKYITPTQNDLQYFTYNLFTIYVSFFYKKILTLDFYKSNSELAQTDVYYLAEQILYLAPLNLLVAANRV